MSPKSFAGLFVVTVIAAVAAAWILLTHDVGAPARGRGALAFPELAEQVNNVRKIVVKRADGTSTIQSQKKNGELQWSIKELHGYPVPIEIVRAVAAGMAQLRLVEPKTRRADLYHRIHVENPDKKGSKGALVTLFDGKGDKMASLIVGLDEGGVISVGNVFVRRPDEARSWLAHGKVPVPEKRIGWLNQTIIDVDLPRVRESTLYLPGHPPLHIYKKHQGDEDFIVEGMPKGYELKNLFGAEDIARSIQTLTLTDVKPMSAVGLSYDGQPRLRHVTFDGMIVEEWAKKVGGKLWIAVKARPDPDPKDPKKVDKAKIAKEVAKINGVTNGWAYTVSPFETKQFEKTLPGMIKPKATPKAPAKAPAEGK